MLEILIHLCSFGSHFVACLALIKRETDRRAKVSKTMGCGTSQPRQHGSAGGVLLPFQPPGMHASNPSNPKTSLLDRFVFTAHVCADKPPSFKVKLLEGELGSVVKPLDHSALIAEKSSQLMKATREWILPAVVCWLLDPSSTLFWLTGDGGTGKSVISAMLLHRLPGLGGVPLAWYMHIVFLVRAILFCITFVYMLRGS